MRINNTNDEVEFRSLTVGTMFNYEDFWCIKISKIQDSRNCYNCVDLRDGEASYVESESLVVSYPNASINIGENERGI